LCLQKNKAFEDQGPKALDKMRKINLELDDLMKTAGRELEEKDPTELLSALRQKILECYDIEKKALERLVSIV